jgi:hypothetical protein
VLVGLVLPAVVAAAALVVAFVLAKLSGRGSSGPWKIALALGAGYLAGHIAIAWPSSDVTDRIPPLAVAAMVLGMLEATWPGPPWARWENRLLLSALVVGLIVEPARASLEETQGLRGFWIAMGIVGLVIFASWTNLEALAARVRGVAIALPMLVVAGGMSAVLALSGSMLLGQLGGALTAALAAAWIASWRGEPLSLSRGGVPVLVVVLSALALEGQVYSPAPGKTTMLALVAVAPFALWILRIGPLRRLAPWQAALLGAVIALVPIGVALGMALTASAEVESY